MKESSNKKNSVRKNTTKKTVVKKSQAKKVQAKAPVKKVVKKTPVKNIQTKVEPKKEIKLNSNELNKELILKTIVIVSYTLIIAILIMGFVDSMVKTYTTSVEANAPYIISSGAVDETMNVDLSLARLRFANLKGDYFVYLNYGSSTSAKSLEIGIKALIEQYNLKDKFYYINIDSLKNEEDEITKINEALGLQEALISKVPTIYYVNSDGILRIENIIARSDDNIMTIGDFQNLLDINNY